ncbi:MAG: tryptophan--tRNA ligase [Fimbriimonas sp.]|nr:tryptophan--tRNA ligase [Fimbriimonas sp.]
MSSTTDKKRILSGMRSTGPKLHIGNYEGALRNWVGLQDTYKMFCMVADWHALTTQFSDTSEISRNAREVAKDFIAGGIDPDKSPLFIQSHVKEHAELHLLLSMVTPLGWLERVPTFKEKQQDVGGAERVPYGLLGYPVLQASDILLYKPYGVPVGKDQAPHLEVSREIGRRFNNLYGEVFPEFVNIIGDVPVLPGLDMRKMSKTYDNCVYINESPDETAKKIKSAFTTPTKIKKSDPGIPEGCAVCQYLKLYSPNWEQQWQEDRDGIRGCMQNKNECIEAVNEFLRPMRERRAQIDDGTIEDILRTGAAQARQVAQGTLQEVREAMKLW